METRMINAQSSKQMQVYDKIKMFREVNECKCIKTTIRITNGK